MQLAPISLTAPRGILAPYERRKTPGFFKRAFFYIALVFIAAFYGLMCSVLPLQALSVPLLPILMMAALILWLMPSVESVDYAKAAGFMLWYAGMNAVWPNYVAVDLPGLPWITPTRFAVLGMALIFVYSFAVSRAMRTSLRTILDTAPAIKWSFWIFWICTTVAIVFSKAISDTVTKYSNNQIYWTLMFLGATLIAYDNKNLYKINNLIRVMVGGAIISSLLGIMEFHYERVIWLDHLPPFLKPAYDLFDKLEVSNARAYTEQYRVTGQLGNALYFAEFLAVIMPFLLDLLVREKGVIRKALLGTGLAAVSVAIYLTGSRAGMVGLLLTPVLYTLIAALRWRSRSPSSLAASAILFAYPVAVAMLVALVIFWRRLHVLVIGGGQHEASNIARDTQWTKGFKIIASRPLGHGAGQSGDVLGFYNPGHDNFTVDTYYLTLLLDYGYLGFLAFMMFFVTCAAHSARFYFKVEEKTELILLPIGIAIINFVIIKAVASTESSMPIVIMLAGFGLGITAHITKSLPARS